MGIFLSKAESLWRQGKFAFLDAQARLQRVGVLRRDALFERCCQQLGIRLEEPDAVPRLAEYIDWLQRDVARRLEHPRSRKKLRHAQRRWDNKWRKVMGVRQIPTPYLPGVRRAQPEVRAHLPCLLPGHLFRAHVDLPCSCCTGRPGRHPRPHHVLPAEHRTHSGRGQRGQQQHLQHVPGEEIYLSSCALQRAACQACLITSVLTSSSMYVIRPACLEQATTAWEDTILGAAQEALMHGAAQRVQQQQQQPQQQQPQHAGAAEDLQGMHSAALLLKAHGDLLMHCGCSGGRHRAAQCAWSPAVCLLMSSCICGCSGGRHGARRG